MTRICFVIAALAAIVLAKASTCVAEEPVPAYAYRSTAEAFNAPIPSGLRFSGPNSTVQPQHERRIRGRKRRRCMCVVRAAKHAAGSVRRVAIRDTVPDWKLVGWFAPWGHCAQGIPSRHALASVGTYYW